MRPGFNGHPVTWEPIGSQVLFECSSCFRTLMAESFLLKCEVKSPIVEPIDPEQLRIPRVFVQPFRLNPYTHSEGFRTPQPGSVL